MLPTSDAQYKATVSGGLPPLEAVRPGIWALAQPFNGLTTSHTLSYLLADCNDRLHLIDPALTPMRTGQGSPPPSNRLAAMW